MKIKKTIRNRKAQFFIAVAVIIVIVVFGVFFTISKTEQVETVELEVVDPEPFFDSLEREYQMAADLAMNDVSLDPSLDPFDTFDSYLLNQKIFTEDLAAQKGYVLDSTYTILTATSTLMNASVDLHLITPSTVLDKFFYADAVGGGLEIQEDGLQQNPCFFNFTAEKEVGMPIEWINPNTSYVDVDGQEAHVCNWTPFPEIGPTGWQVNTVECDTSLNCATDTVLTVYVYDERNVLMMDSVTIGGGGGGSGNCTPAPPDSCTPYGCSGSGDYYNSSVGGPEAGNCYDNLTACIADGPACVVEGL